MPPSSTTKWDKPAATYYKLDVGRLPDDLFNVETPAKEWLESSCCTWTSDPSGFGKHSFQTNTPQTLDWDVELERTVGIALYMIMNVVPFLILPMLVLYYGVATDWAKYSVQAVLLYVAVLSAVELFYFKPRFLAKYNQHDKVDYFGRQPLTAADWKRNQYVWTERNTSKYLSIQFVWPAALQRPNHDQQPLIFCMVPHAVAPLGVTAYPLWSKLFNDKLCRWTCAPVVLQIPMIGNLVKKIGYIPAKAHHIQETLVKRGENVGIILDGIAGMFHHTTSSQQPHVETLVLHQRKAIVKIALKAGAPLVPVYGFGHSDMYSVWVDPCGILEQLSISLQAALTPFFGRWGWFLGPPKRVPVVVVVGEPVKCPQVQDPTQHDIDTYHGKLLDAYQELFDTHKHAYGWSHKQVKFV